MQNNPIVQLRVGQPVTAGPADGGSDQVVEARGPALAGHRSNHRHCRWLRVPVVGTGAGSRGTPAPAPSSPQPRPAPTQAPTHVMLRVPTPRPHPSPPDRPAAEQPRRLAARPLRAVPRPIAKLLSCHPPTPRLIRGMLRAWGAYVPCCPLKHPHNTPHNTGALPGGIFLPMHAPTDCTRAA